MRKPTALMLSILSTASQAPDGVAVRDLVARHMRAGRSRRVAQAAVGAALRRLWRRGWVELHDSRYPGVGRTMTEQRQRASDVAARARSDPDAFYREVTTFRRGLGVVLRATRVRFPESPAALLQLKERQVERPKLRAVRVTLTSAGRGAGLEHFTSATESIESAVEWGPGR